MFGWMELLVILLILLLIFGASRLPKIARSLGESVGALKEGLEEGQEALEEDSVEEDSVKEATGEEEAGEDEAEAKS